MGPEPGETAGSAHDSGGIDGRTVAAEAAGAGFIAFAVVSAGILGERHAIHDVALALTITALTGALAFLVLARALEGHARCYFNPALTLAIVLSGRMPLAAGLTCAAAQILAAFTGVFAAHLVTNTGIVQTATQIYSGPGVWLGEALATAFFTFAALMALARGRNLMPVTGAACLLVAALATPSISFANPALTLARSLTDSFTAIALSGAVLIAAFQFLAAIGGWAFYRWMNPKPPA